MKKFAAGILTALCATAIATAQPTDQYAPGNVQSNEWVDAQQSTAAQQVEQSASVQQPANVQNSISATNSTITNITNVTYTTNVNANDNTAMPIDEQPVVLPPKKSPVGIGARAAFIYGNFWGFKDLESDGMEPPTGFGGEFGITARFGMVDGLQFAPEILFRIFDVSHDEDEIEREYNQMFLDFALYIRGIFGGGFFLEVGPQVSINTSSEYTYDGHTNNFEKIEQASAEFGLNFGAGYYILDNLSLNFRWYMGFTEIFPDVKYEGDINSIKDEKNKKNTYWSTINLKGAHTMMFKFGVTYWFI